MSDPGASAEHVWKYRFLRPGGDEIETQEYKDDETAEGRARDISKAEEIPVIIHRLHGHVDWQYVTEVDERP